MTDKPLESSMRRARRRRRLAARLLLMLLLVPLNACHFHGRNCHSSVSFCLELDELFCLHRHVRHCR